MILNRVKGSLKNNEGSGLLWGIILIFVLFMFFSATSEYLRSYVVLNGVRDGLQSIATNIATENYNEIYSSEREGYFGAYKLSNTDKWEEDVDKSSLDSELNKLLGVKKEGSSYVKRYSSNNEVEYTLSNLKLKIENPSLAPTDQEVNKKTFTVEITADTELYKLYDFFDSDNIKTKLGAKAGYIPKF